MANPEVLALFGSPVKESFSSEIHSRFLDKLESCGISIARVYPYINRAEPCSDCRFCETEFGCTNSDVMDELYPLLKSSKLISLSSPVYFSGLPSHLKAFIDRTQPLWHLGRRDGNAISKKKGILFSTAGSSYGGAFDGTVRTVRHFFNTVNAEYSLEDFILLPDTDSLNEVPLELLSKAENTGARYSRLIGGSL